MQAMSATEAFRKAAALCSMREYCIFDIREKLRQWDALEHQSIVIEQLVAEKFLDQNRFAKAFVRDKFLISHWGRIKIAFALKQKDIPSVLISETFENEIDKSKYLETLKKLVLQKKKETKGEDNEAKKAKIVRFAQSRGFELSLILKLLKE